MMIKKDFDLLSMGEVLLRLSPFGEERLNRGDTFRKQVGGAECNVLAGVSLLGLRTGIISRIPNNAIGVFARNQIRANGISDDYLLYDESDQGRLGVYYYESGAYPRKPRVVYDRKHTSMDNINVKELPESIYERAGCFHTSGITLAISESSRDTAIELIRRFKSCGATISFDVNFRGNLWSGEEARTCIEKILPLVDIFFCSVETAKLTFHKEGSDREILKSFADEYNVEVVASTKRIVKSPRHHDFGSLIYDAASDSFFEEEPYENIEVVDRIGSGDAYVAGALYGYLSSGGDIEKMLEFGNAYSAIKNTIPGDLPSSDRFETEDIIVVHKGLGDGLEMKR